MATESNEKIQKRYRIVGMDLDDEELKSKIREYKQDAEDGIVELPSWPDFVARAGLTEAVCDAAGGGWADVCILYPGPGAGGPLAMV